MGPEGPRGPPGPEGPPAPQPTFGQFLPSQVVHGAILTCASVTEGGRRCDGIALNGIAIYLDTREAEVICQAVTGNSFRVAGSSFQYSEATRIRWNGTTWSLTTSVGLEMTYVSCRE